MLTRSRILAAVAAFVLPLGVALSGTSTASAAPGFVATPNGMVGLTQEIVIKAPSMANQVATIGFTSSGVSNAGQTNINANGFGSLAWTPTSAGSWTISGLGDAASSGSTTITVAPMPTVTNALVPNLVQAGVTNTVTVAVSGDQPGGSAWSKLSCT